MIGGMLIGLALIFTSIIVFVTSKNSEVRRGLSGFGIIAGILVTTISLVLFVGGLIQDAEIGRQLGDHVLGRHLGGRS